MNKLSLINSGASANTKQTYRSQSSVEKHLFFAYDAANVGVAICCTKMQHCEQNIYHALIGVACHATPRVAHHATPRVAHTATLEQLHIGGL